MRSKNSNPITPILFIFMFISAIVAYSASANEMRFGESAQGTGAQTVMLFEIENYEGYVDVESGEIVRELPPLNGRAVSFGGQLGLTLRTSRTDINGILHQAYYQTFSPPKGFMKNVPAWNGEPMLIKGGYVSYHSNSKGRIQGLTGTIFVNIRHVFQPRYTVFSKIFEKALTGGRRSGEFTFRDRENLSRQELREAAKGTNLWLVSSGDGNSFVPAWQVPVPLAGGGWAKVLIDSVTGNFIETQVQRAKPQQRCESETGSRRVAGYSPQRPGREIYSSLWATDVIAPTQQIPFEAVWVRPPLSRVPTIQAYLGTISGCTSHYSLARPKDLAGLPVYDDWEYTYDVVGFPVTTYNVGKATGDAIHNTYLTWKALAQYGWEGLSGFNGTVNIVVDATCSTYDIADVRDNALFLPEGSKMANEDFAPANSVAICRNNDDSEPFALLASVSLDILAHEWGHGVIHKSPADFSDNAMQEGYADIIGYGVEWLEYGPYGWANWTAGEDFTEILPLDRLVDVATGGWDAVLRFHDDDQTYRWADGAPQSHAYGNILPVAFRLMVEGGENPVCVSQTLSGCGGLPVTPFSDDHATSVDTAMRIMIKALDYLQPNATWINIRSAAMAAASGTGGPVMTISKNGSFPSLPTCICYTEEKETVYDAFKAIGLDSGVCWVQCYPGSGD